MAANDYRSLYDMYRLSNSSVVPQFTGTTAPEALQVGAKLEQDYNVAKSLGYETDSAVDSVQYLDKDRALADELRTKVHGDISRMAKAGDWEHQGDSTRQLARMYAQRSSELYTPVKQAQEYQKSLEEKDLDLTPTHKAALMAMSRDRYQGLKKDPYGRYTGSFNGVAPAKVVNMTKFTDEVMNGMKEFKNASKIDYVNQNGFEGYIVKRGQSTEYVTKARVDDALDQAMALRPDVQAHISQEGDIAGYQNSKVNWDGIPDTNPVKQSLAAAAASRGMNISDIAGIYGKNSTEQKIKAAAHQYARDKYVYRKTDSELGLSGDPVWEHNEKQKNQLGMFADAVTDTGIDVSAKYGSADKIIDDNKLAQTSAEDAQTKLDAIRQQVAKATGTGLNSLSDDQAIGYLSQKSPAAVGEYKQLQQAIQQNRQTVDETNAVKDDSMERALRKKSPGASYTELKQSATNDFQKAITDGKVNMTIKSETGKERKLNSETMKDFTVVDGDNGNITHKGYVVLRDNAGREYKVSTEAGVASAGIGGRGTSSSINTIDSETMNKIGGRFDGIDWKTNWKEAAQNLRSNSIVIPLINKTTPDGETTKTGAYATRVSSILRGGTGGLTVLNADNIKMDSDDTKDMRARIAGGQFDVLGVTKRNDGKLTVKLSVVADKDASDPADKFKTVYVQADTNLANKLSLSAVEAGKRDGDIRAIQMGMALRPGSGYESVLNLGPSGRMYVKDRPQVSASGTLQQGKNLYEVVPQVTGSDSDALSYEVYKLNPDGTRTGASVLSTGDAFELATQLDIWKQEGKTLLQNNAR